MMKLPVTLAGLALIALPLAACSDNAQQESSEAADAIGDDMERTGDEAWQATQEATQDARSAADRLGDDIEQGARETGAAADRLGDDISRGADAAADRTGAALQNAGSELRD